MCESNLKSGAALANHPLFDTPYKAAANYIPVLIVRALGSTEIYRKKGHAHLTRSFHVRNLQGKLAEPYETMVIDIEVAGKGLFGRIGRAHGFINDLEVNYENIASFGLPKKAFLNVIASLDGCEMMKYKVQSDGDKLTNDVDGVFLGQAVKYHTQWRNTSGTLAGTNYQLNVEGNGKGSLPCDKENIDSSYCKEHKNDKKTNLYSAKSNGKIGSYMISGWLKETRTGHFESEEIYGPIVVKSTLDVFI